MINVSDHESSSVADDCRRPRGFGLRQLSHNSQRATGNTTTINYAPTNQPTTPPDPQQHRHQQHKPPPDHRQQRPTKVETRSTHTSTHAPRSASATAKMPKHHPDTTKASSKTHGKHKSGLALVADKLEPFLPRPCRRQRRCRSRCHRAAALDHSSWCRPRTVSRSPLSCRRDWHLGCSSSLKPLVQGRPATSTPACPCSCPTALCQGLTRPDSRSRLSCAAKSSSRSAQSTAMKAALRAVRSRAGRAASGGSRR